MKDREPPHLPAGLRRALRCLSLLLLPALSLDNGRAGPGLRSTIRPHSDPTPYLPVLGSPSLRFQEALPPPDLVTRPAASAPPVPPLSPVETSVAAANADAAHTVIPPPQPAKAAAETAPSEPNAKTPAPILPDNARPIVHPEDFLPYFEIPGTAKQPADVTVNAPVAPSAPAPAALPASSATYTQTPK